MAIKKPTEYEKKISELHSQIEAGAMELQQKIELLEKIKKDIADGQLHKNNLIKVAEEKEAEIARLEKAIREKEKQLSMEPDEVLTDRIKGHIANLREGMDNLHLEEFQKRIEENRKLVEENNVLLEKKEELEKSIESSRKTIATCQSQLDDIKAERKKIYEDLNKAREEYAFMERQVMGFNDILRKIKFYAERLYRVKGKNVVPELEEIGPFKFFPSEKLKAKIVKHEQKDK